ncbi:carboxymuconolactone decarboxylase family protein [Rhizobiaceae bacterium CRRU44]|uniref:Carboxymuconolactone decarboxylase family protein n=1 Tax=Ferranicluibacter rubi TaxID=2715133 RepID=A0AA43ZL39_9HYPH|nr:carboxymuconolactone decarboxylase family protein [Ferranicluibacter rubi]NHT78986.1 carboxymuconolactone decarboxylase family protein [Ferranicluibacter rubi]PYE31714.1 4-carboxymuconolactone decarboxylase [Rhizobium sp. PP-WC-1G-195]
MFQQIRSHVVAAGAASLLGLFPDAALAQTTDERRERGAAVVRSLNNNTTQPTLEGMRREFLFLAEATEAYARGDVWSRPGLDNRTRQLAAVAAFAAICETAFMRVHAGYALNIGVSEEELKEVIYMVTVPAGLPKAIAASQVLAQLCEDRRQADSGGPAEPSTATPTREEARP